MTKLVRKIGLVELRIAHGAQVLLYRYYGNSYS